MEARGIDVFKTIRNNGFPIEELNRCAVDFANISPISKIACSPPLLNQDYFSLVDRVESQYNFLCYTVSMA
jgi:hypothetical protein